MHVKQNIPFSHFTPVGNESNYIAQAMQSGAISGNGDFTKKCQHFFESNYGFKRALFTSSCSDALEMAAILCGVEAGDEVIIPSYTFVSTANAFILRGAKIVFADSENDFPNIDASAIEKLISKKTRVIVVVHYAGIACDMDKITALAEKYNLLIVEDAAHAIDSFYKGRPLGSIGHFATFSFHVTKNLTCGEGGLLAINDSRFIQRAEIIWEKGTNRSAFFRGEVDKYGWVDIGSSFLASDMLAAFLYAQIEKLDTIQAKRKEIWNYYYNKLLVIQKKILLPLIPDFATVNGHLFFLVCKNLEERTGLIKFLNDRGIHAVFHYLSLHSSPYYKEKHDGRILPNSDRFTDCIVRLPIYYDLSIKQAEFIVDSIVEFLK